MSRMKNAEMRRFWGLTWQGWANYLVLRWFGWRIVRTVEDDGTVSSTKLQRWRGTKW